MRVKALIHLIAIFLVISLSQVPFASPFELRISHQLPETHIIAKNFQEFKRLVEQRTNGKIKVTIFPAAQALSPAESIRAVSTGVIEAAAVPNMEWARLVQTMEVFLVPYVATELSTIERIFSGEVGAKLFKKMEEKGVIPVMWLLQTRRTIYTSKDKFLLSPSDFKGKKARGTSKIMNLSLEAMGAQCVPIAGPEAMTALQTGVVDIGLTGPDAALVRHYYDIHKYGVIAHNMSVVWPFFLNPKFWRSLPQEIQVGVKEVCETIQKKSIRDSEEFALWAIGELKKKMNIHILSPEEEKQWKNVMQPPVREYFIKTTGAEGAEILNQIERISR